jgi:protein-tyrosine phosphatase
MIDLEGCFNFRDLGGYRAAGGRRVRWRRLFRSDGLSRLSGSDLARLRALGLRTVIDLRTASEVDQRGSIERGADLTYHHLPLVDVLPPGDELAEWSRPEYVADQYATMLESGADTVLRALRLLCEPDTYPVAYHCMAGKDRTGILSALVLSLLGVDEGDIVDDYALSGQAMQRMLDRLRAEHPERAAQLDASAPALVAADPEAMVRFLAGLRDRHGGVEGYVRTIGLPEAGTALKDLLLES